MLVDLEEQEEINFEAAAVNSGVNSASNDAHIDQGSDEFISDNNNMASEIINEPG